MKKCSSWKKRSRYIDGQLYVLMDAAGRFTLPRKVLPEQGYRVVKVDNEVHIIQDRYSSSTNTRITISSQIRSDLALKADCVFKVEKQIIDNEEHLILRKVENAQIKW